MVENFLMSHSLIVYTLNLLLGFVSNGEHNELRAKGYTRPVSIFNIKSVVRAKYSRMSANEC